MSELNGERSEVSMNERRRQGLNDEVTTITLEIHRLQELAADRADVATLADIRSMLVDATYSPNDDFDLVMIESVEYALAMAATRLRTLRAALVPLPHSGDVLGGEDPA